MTVPQWESEVAEALAGSGWKAAYANVTPDSNDCLLEARCLSTGEHRHVTLSVNKFVTREARRLELRRQLA
jgi:hypothetical protein